MPQADEHDSVEASVPASASFVPLARLDVAVVASVLGCSVDEVEDLRLAVEELCLWAMRRPRTYRGRLLLSFSWEEGFLDASCTLVEDDVPVGEDVVPDALLDTLSMQILAALADEHGFDSDGPSPRAWLRKKRTPR
jgi:serine/threonine-protein kinase RsbW